MNRRPVVWSAIMLMLWGTCAQRLRGQGPAGKEPSAIDKLILEAASLQSRKRYIDALAKLDEAEKIDSKRADIYNVRGAIYITAQLRDAARARAEFTKARELMPGVMPPVFNLAEVDFVTHEWASAEKAFRELLVQFPKLPAAARHLVQFKQLICLVKQGKIAEAQKLLDENFTFMDDTPAYYFSKAILALEAKDTTKGNEWLLKAQKIFKPPHSTAYVDSLAEARYIDELTLGKPDAQDANPKP
ncbi:MAG: tetratricopeptide repeat protein [Verrucomicrobiaceae bacterium]